MHQIIAVGGTGQEVLQHYLMLYLGGLVEPFDAVVIDADKLRPGLDILSRFLEDTVTDSSNHHSFSTYVPRLEYLPVQLGKASVFQVLMGYNEPDRELTAADAFFSREDQIQVVDRGLFARPALSSVVPNEVLNPDKLLPRNGNRTIVVGSLLGGTGGGLIARIIDQIESAGRSRSRDMKIRGVLFGEFFEPDPGTIDRDRMRSNLLMSMRALREGKQNLHSYSIVHETRSRKRASAEAERLPVPGGQDPIWDGVNAVKFHHSDEIKDHQSDFLEREVPLRQSIATSTAQRRLARVAAHAETFAQKLVIKKVRHEPTDLWGSSLTSFVRSCEKDLSVRFDLRRGSLKLAAETKRWWTDMKLANLFEAPDSVQPSAFQRLSLPDFRTTMDHDITSSRDLLIRKASAAVLLNVMRSVQG